MTKGELDTLLKALSPAFKTMQTRIDALQKRVDSAPPLPPSVFKGHWAEVSSYGPGEFVISQGAVWLALRRSSSDTPPFEGADWKFLTQT